MKDALLAVALTQKLYAFFDALDARRYDDMESAFTTDGRWLRQGKWTQGRAEVRATLEERPAHVQTRHVISNAYLTQADDSSATVEAVMTAYRHVGKPGEPQDLPVLPGAFRINLVHTRFRRVGDDWLIAEQQMVPEFAFAT